MAHSVVTLRVVQTEDAIAESSSIRSQKRAYLSPDLLRTFKLAAGEWVCLRASSESTSSVIAQLWPRVGVEDDGEDL